MARLRTSGPHGGGSSAAGIAVTARQFWERRADHLRVLSIARILGALGALLAFAAPLCWVSAEYVRTHVVVMARGVETTGVVVDRTVYRRAPDELVVRTLDDLSVTTTLSHWPPGTTVGSQIDIAYDPRNPGRVVALDAPPVDLLVAGFALADLGVLALLVILLPPSVRVLAERARKPRHTRTGRAQAVAVRAVGGAWRAVGRTAREMGAGKAVLALVGGPVMFFALGSAALVWDAQRLAALEDRGVAGTAVVTGSEWDDGVGVSLLVRVEDEGPATIRNWSGVPRKGDVIDVVYDAQNHRNIVQAGVHPWNRDDWGLAAVAVGGGVATAFVTPAAVAGLVRRDRPRRG